ncbi:MAG TPA: hypothetical protein VKO18_08735 [Terriglobia bacterium]|nr:hypothetical protein [Terriglobia bacterium]
MGAELGGDSRDSTRSSLRESIIEHIFAGEILRKLWLRDEIHENVTQVEILKPQVDDAGYDLVIDCNSSIRHVQLKSSRIGAKRDSVNVSLKLAQKPSGCVIWVFFDPSTVSLEPFLWFGSRPGNPLPGIETFKVTQHTKGDATGKKANRSGLRDVPKGRFERLDSIDDVIDRLFEMAPGKKGVAQLRAAADAPSGRA